MSNREAEGRMRIRARERDFARSVCAALLAVGSFFSFSSPASATPTDVHGVARDTSAAIRFRGVISNLHGVAINRSILQRGTQAGLLIVSGSANDCGSNNAFTQQAIWEGTNNNPNSFYWIEAGYTYCFNNQPGLYNFWADNRPSFGYFEHLLGSTPGVGIVETFKIRDNGNNTWTVILGNSTVGTSTSNPSGSRWMSAGGESTSPFSELNFASAQALKYLQPNGGPWSTQWPTSTTLESVAPWTVNWVTIYKKVRDNLN